VSITMHDKGILVIKAHEVRSLLETREQELISTVRAAYQAHRNGHSALPRSAFLQFQHAERNRIIALPAYLGGDFDVAGMKWIASFPANPRSGLDRASAVVILNCARTGIVKAIIEGSIISAKRTAASAALAALSLSGSNKQMVAAFVGCGPINFEVARFLLAVFPHIRELLFFDLDERKAKHFEIRCRQSFGDKELTVAKTIEELFRRSKLISFATTAARPHVHDISDCAPGTTILHVSLRDLSPQVVLSCDNIVDDVEHVCAAETSVHLTERLVGNRKFIRCSLADILDGSSPALVDEKTHLFSPFGLGILDLAVGALVFDLASRTGVGTRIDSFLPDSWVGDSCQ
jgi:2,3-diaminopropionate biosynthesis protein SbnB